MFRPHYKKVADWETNQWIGRGFPVQMPTEVIIAKGQNLEAGSVLGRKADGKYVLSAAQNGAGEAIKDGTEKPRLILAEPIDARAYDMRGVAFRTGSYIKQGLTFGKGHTPETTRDDLELRSIYFEEGTN